jgi:hypothetical protein
MRRSAELQPEIYPLPALRKPWFKRNTIVCGEGWSVQYSGSSWRVDRYDYFENGRQIVFSGEGAAGQMDIFLYPHLAWEDSPDKNADELTRQRVLHNITAALQWAGFSVGFFPMSNPTTH